MGGMAAQGGLDKKKKKKKKNSLDFLMSPIEKEGGTHYAVVKVEKDPTDSSV